MQLTLDTADPTFGLSVPSLGAYRLSEAYSWPGVQHTTGVYGPTMVRVPPSSRSSSRSRSPSPRARSPPHGRSRSPSPTDGRDRPGPMPHATLPAPNYGGLSTTYDVPGLITVPNTAQAHTVTIADLALDADFSWLVIPKVNLHAHLKVSYLIGFSDYM